MSNLLESYRVLGVKVGAGMSDVTTSYRQLCRTHHPDISDNPESEELMKQINIAYTVLREKFKRESTFRDRQTYTRPIRRYPTPPPKPPVTTDAQQQASQAYEATAAQSAAASAEAEREARAVLHDYFIALNTYDYAKAYGCLSDHDKKHITLEGFTGWREAVARLYPMREFKIASGSSIAVVTWGDEKTFHARKFRVVITEDDFSDEAKQSEDVDKLVIHENSRWGVFLGYREINELTRTFDERFETKNKRNIEKRLKEHSAGLHPEYNMLNLGGMQKPVSVELYRQRRYGSTLTFAAISIRHKDSTGVKQDELLRSAAKTIVGALRETDIPAYGGDGVFAILFIELGKKNAENILDRLVDLIIKNAGAQLGSQADVRYEYDTWSGNGYADMDVVNNILKKFNKNI